MDALDDINGRFGKWTAVTASQGFKREWKLRSYCSSPPQSPNRDLCRAYWLIRSGSKCATFIRNRTKMAPDTEGQISPLPADEPRGLQRQ